MMDRTVRVDVPSTRGSSHHLRLDPPGRRNVELAHPDRNCRITMYLLLDRQVSHAKASCSFRGASGSLIFLLFFFF